MTPKEKSKEIFNSIRNIDNESGKDCITCDCVVVPIAIYVVNEIQSALYNYLKDTNELQNADREFVYWNEVEKELNILK